MALSGLYRRLATQVTGRLRYVPPLCLAAGEKVLHTSSVVAAAPDPKPVPLPKLKDRYYSIPEVTRYTFRAWPCDLLDILAIMQYVITYTIHKVLYSSFPDGLRSFLDGTSSTYLEELEERYRADPTSVDKTWASFFKSLGISKLPRAQRPLLIITLVTCLSMKRFGTRHGCKHVHSPDAHSASFTCCSLSAEQGVAPEAVAEAYHAYEQGSQVAPLSAAAVSNQTIQESQRLLLLVRAYQASPHNHMHATMYHPCTSARCHFMLELRCTLPHD